MRGNPIPSNGSDHADHTHHGCLVQVPRHLLFVLSGGYLWFEFIQPSRGLPHLRATFLQVQMAAFEGSGMVDGAKE